MGRHTQYVKDAADAIEAASGVTLTVYPVFEESVDLDNALLLQPGRRFSAAELGGNATLEGYSVEAAAFMRLTDGDLEDAMGTLDTQFDALKEALRFVSGYGGVFDFEVEWQAPVNADGVDYVWATLKWRTIEG